MFSVVAVSLKNDLEISFSKVLAVVVSTALFGLLFGGLALAVGCLMPGRTRAVAIDTAAAFAAWMLDGLAKVASWLEPFQGLSPYHQAYGESPLSNGPDWGGWLLLVLVTAGLLAVAVAGLGRRDVRQ